MFLFLYLLSAEVVFYFCYRFKEWNYCEDYRLRGYYSQREERYDKLVIICLSILISALGPLSLLIIIVIMLSTYFDGEIVFENSDFYEWQLNRKENFKEKRQQNLKRVKEKRKNERLRKRMNLTKEEFEQIKYH